MKTESEFRSYYEKTITSQLEELEKEKLRAKQVKKITIISLVVGVLIINLLLLSSPFIIVSVPITSLLGFFAYWAITYSSSNDYESDFKDIITRGIIAFFNPDMTYDPDNGIAQQGFEVSGLFLDNPKNFTSNDHIKGTLGETNIQFSWCGQLATKAPVFQGIFFIADFNKPFEGEIYVLPKVLRAGNLIGRVEIMRPPRVTMENTDFNNRYYVYGTDPVGTRYVLTPAMMEKMLALDQKADGDVYFSFDRGYMFVAMSIDDEIFEPKNFDGGYERFSKLYRYLNMTFDLVDDFGLNTRIWGS